MINNKIIASSCVAVTTGTAVVLGIQSWKKSERVTGDGELQKTDTKKCGCPFATPLGVGLVTGVLSGTFTWILFDRV